MIHIIIIKSTNPINKFSKTYYFYVPKNVRLQEALKIKERMKNREIGNKKYSE